MAALKTLIELNRDNLQIYSPGKEVISVIFSEKAVDDLEVKDQKYLFKEISKTLISEKLKPQRAIIVLGEDLLFSKTCSIKDLDKRDKAIRDFLDEIPFEPNTIVHKNFPTKNGVKIVAANNNLYMNVLRIFQDHDWLIKYIVPKDAVSKTYNEDTLKESLRDIKKLEAANFYTFEHKEINSVWKIGLGIALTLSILAGFYYFISTATNKAENISEEKIVEQPIINVVEDLIEESSIEESIIEKNEISIQILNGTGRTGQAGKTSEIINILGFENIEVDNADNSDYYDTQLIFSSNVPEDYIEEIGDALKEMYEGIIETPKDEDDNINYDIVIITGKVITSN